MALLGLPGRPWTLRILCELREEPATFRRLQPRCDGLSPSVLNQRLAELRESGIVQSGDGGYSLTPVGWRLLAALAPLNESVAPWAESLQE